MTHTPHEGVGPEAAPPAGVPQEWAWAKPQQPLVPQQTEPLEYHRLYRGIAKYRWWKPLVVLVLAASIFFAINLTYTLVLMPILAIFDPDYLNDALINQTAPMLDTQHPLSLVLNLGAIIAMIPAVLLAMLALGIRPVGRVWSVAGRIRWGLLGRSLGAAVVGLIVMNVVGVGVETMLSGLGDGDAPLTSELPADFNVTAAVISMVLVVLLMPLQATAEEVVFRGLLLQVLGSWMRSPWLAVGLSSMLFASMHIYDIWGLLVVGIMGLFAAWLTWKTGGLEAAIAIHVLNNLVAFSFMASGITGETGQVEGGGGLGSVIGEVIGLSVFALLVVRSFKKHGYGRERIDTLMVPAPVIEAPNSAPAAPAAPVAPVAPAGSAGPAGSHEEPRS